MRPAESRDRRHDLWFAVAVAVALGIFGLVSHGGLRLTDSTYASRNRSDARMYLSMAAHRWIDGRWIGGIPDEYSLYNVPLPFRYRVLVPWLASLLPFDPVLSLPFVNYVSLVGAYVFLLLTCRVLGVRRWPSAIGLLVAFTFVSHVSVYSLPWLTDGFILLVLSAMTYAFVTDRFWLFAAWGLAGVFAREVPAVLLPLWCLRSVTRGVAITVVAAAAVAIERLVLAAPAGVSSAVHPSWVLSVMKETIAAGPSGASYWPPRFSRKLVTDIAYCWGWGFAMLPVGLLLLPRDGFRRFMPVAGVLLMSAFGMSLIATDTSREFMVLLPVVVVAVAQLTAALLGEAHVGWAILLLGLGAVQFCLSEENIVFETATWAAVSARVPMIKIGTVWAVGAALLVRATLMRRSRERWNSFAQLSGLG